MTGWWRSLDVYRDRRVVAILLLGFSSGLPLALTGQTLQAWLTEAQINIGTIGLFAAVGIPYSLKFLWAPLIDKLALPPLTTWLGRRRGWMIATQALLIAAMIGLGSSDPMAAIGVTAAWAFLLAFASASQDIVIDAWRVEMLEERQLAAGAAAIVFGYRIGMLVSGAGALYLAQYLGNWFLVYAVFGVLMLVGIATILLAGEPAPSDAREDRARSAEIAAFLARRPAINPTVGNVVAWIYVAVIGPLREFASRPSWLAILLFVLLFKFGDALAGSMSTTFYLKLGFQKIDIANVAKVYGFAATFIGLFLGGWLMNAIGLIPALWVAGILQMLSNLMYVPLAYTGDSLTMLAVSVGIENLTGGMGTAALVAYLSALCNVSYTATQYALLSSFSAVGRTGLSTTAGYLAEAFGWVGFFLLTVAAALPGLLLLLWLTRRGAATRPRAAPAGSPLLVDD